MWVQARIWAHRTNSCRFTTTTRYFDQEFTSNKMEVSVLQWGHVGTCLFCRRYWAFWIWSWVPVMVMIRSSEPSRGSSILMEAPDSWRICLILWPPLPMIEPASCWWGAGERMRGVGKENRKKKKKKKRDILGTGDKCVSLKKCGRQRGEGDKRPKQSMVARYVQDNIVSNI